MKALLLAVVALAACHSTAEGPQDFAGSPMYDLTAVVSDDAGEHDDGGARFDASGVGCDPVGSLDGGIATGDWSYVTGCATAEAFYELQGVCSSVAIDALLVTGMTSESGPSGTLILRSDFTYTRQLVERVSAQATFPAACVGTIECGKYQTQLAEQFDWLNITCKASGGGCACAIAMTATFDETGKWVADPEGFTLTSTGGLAEHYSAGTTDLPPLLRYRGDDNTVRGDRGLTLVLQRN